MLDVGSRDVNGSYKELIRGEYIGIDVQPGENVDIVLNNPYVFPFKGNKFDLCLSGQAFEHIEFFWLTFSEMCRVGRHVIVIAPSTQKYHAHPIDCWRFYKDSMPALAKWAGVKLLEHDVDEKRGDCWGLYATG